MKLVLGAAPPLLLNVTLLVVVPPLLMLLHPHVWVLVLYVRALEDPAQPLVPVVGIATAEGDALLPEAFITTVFAAWDARPVRGTFVICVPPVT